MRSAYQFIALILASVFAAALLLAPRADERAAMLVGDGRYEEVIATLERRLALSPGDPEVLAALARVYTEVGDTIRAIDMLDTYLSARPDDVGARKRQAELLLTNGLLDRYLDAKARIVAARPSPDAIEELGELYRLQGRRDDEVAFLRRYGKKSMLRPVQLERLGAMVAEVGDPREAQTWLEAADRAAPPGETASRMRLFELLLQSGQTDQAYSRAESWMRGWQSAYWSGRLMIRLVQSGAGAAANRLAAGYIDLIEPGTFELADLLVQKGQQDIARRMLRQWAERTVKPDARQFRAFVQISAQLGDASGPLLKLAQFARSNFDPDSFGEMAEIVADSYGQPVFAVMRSLLSKDVLIKRPLLGADIALFEGNRELARWFLNIVEPTRLSPRQSESWLELLSHVETDKDTFRRLTALWSERRLPPSIAPHLADQAARFRQPGMHDAIWRSLQ